MSDIVLSRASRNTLLELRTNKFLTERTQRRLTSGLEVANPIDDPVKYFQSKGLTDRSTDLLRRKDAMDQGISTIEASIEGTTSAKKLVDAMIGVVSGIKNGSTRERGESSNQLDSFRDQIQRLIHDASYQGLNLLTSEKTKLTVRFSEIEDSILHVQGGDLNWTSFYYDKDFRNLYQLNEVGDRFLEARNEWGAQGVDARAGLDVVEKLQKIYEDAEISTKFKTDRDTWAADTTTTATLVTALASLKNHGSTDTSSGAAAQTFAQVNAANDTAIGNFIDELKKQGKTAEADILTQMRAQTTVQIWTGYDAAKFDAIAKLATDKQTAQTRYAALDAFWKADQQRTVPATGSAADPTAAQKATLEALITSLKGANASKTDKAFATFLQRMVDGRGTTPTLANNLVPIMNRAGDAQMLDDIKTYLAEGYVDRQTTGEHLGSSDNGTLQSLLSQLEQNAQHGAMVATLQALIDDAPTDGAKTVNKLQSAEIDNIKLYLERQEQYNALEVFWAADVHDGSDPNAADVDITQKHIDALTKLRDILRGDETPGQDLEFSKFLTRMIKHQADGDLVSGSTSYMTAAGDEDMLEKLKDRIAEGLVARMGDVAAMLGFEKALSTYTREAEDLEALDLQIEEALKSLAATKENIEAIELKLTAGVQILQERANFTQEYTDVLSFGSDKLVIADKDRESANLLSLRTSQTLSMQNLSIADQFESSILSLFR